MSAALQRTLRRVLEEAEEALAAATSGEQREVLSGIVQHARTDARLLRQATAVRRYADCGAVAGLREETCGHVGRGPCPSCGLDRRRER